MSFGKEWEKGSFFQDKKNGLGQEEERWKKSSMHYWM
jgi:hypothetical protein